MSPPLLQRIDHESDYGRWTLFRRQPRMPLVGYVRELEGFFEVGGPQLIRRELPSGDVPLILVLGPGFTLHDPAAPTRYRPLNRSFVAGLHEQHTLVGSVGCSICMQVNLTPIGARRLLGVDLNHLADRVVDFGDVVGAFGNQLEQRLGNLDDWPSRFDHLEAALLDRLARGRPETRFMQAAWQALHASAGAIDIECLADQLDYSRKHLAGLFRREFGLTPKKLARVLRFDSAVRRIQAGQCSSLADLATWCGYADQAHFSRDFRAFAGQSPSAVMREMLPDGTGIVAKAG